MGVLDKYFGMGGSSGSAYKPYKPPNYRPPARTALSATPQGGIVERPPRAAGSSRERGAPERMDANTMLGFQAAEMLGRAPGFMYERPLAAVDTLAQEATGVSPIKAVSDFVGGIPILGDLVGGAGEAIWMPYQFMAGMANSSTIDTLARGVREGWDDDRALDSNPLGDFISNLPLLGGLASQSKTWGELKEEARDRGFTEEDIGDRMSGRKGSWDYGDKMVMTDPLGNLAFAVVADPLNLLFGLGIVSKAAKGVGLLTKAIDAGIDAKKLLTPVQSAQAIRSGNFASATWRGMAHYFGQVSRGLDEGAVGLGGAIGRASPTASGLAGAALTAWKPAAKAGRTYRKVAFGTTVAELGVDAVLDNTPLSGFTEGLRDLSQKMIDNQPLSHNGIFLLWSAMNLPFHDAIGKVKSAWRTAEAKGLQSDVRLRMREALGEENVNRLGGPEAFDDLLYHTHVNMLLHGDVPGFTLPPILKELWGKADSKVEAVLKNKSLRAILDETLLRAYEKNAISGKATVDAFVRWFEKREGVEGAVYRWEPTQAVDLWLNYRDAVSPIAHLFNEVGEQITIGLSDELAMTMEDLVHARVVWKMSVKDGLVPFDDFQRVLSTYPQFLLNSRQSAWFKQKLNARADVPFRNLQGKLRSIEKETPTTREMAHEFAAAEAKAPSDIPEAKGPIADDGTLVRDWAEEGSAAIGVSRWRSDDFGVNNTVLDIQAARGRPEVMAAENGIGGVLQDAGFNVERVHQTIGAWEGALEPSVAVMMPAARLPELRLAAAKLGQSFGQDTAIISISGSRMRAMGLKANGVEYIWTLPRSSTVELQRAAEVMSAHFPGWTIDDTAGMIRLAQHRDWIPDNIKVKLEAIDKSLSDIYGRDVIGEDGIVHSTSRAYVETIGKKEAGAHVSYEAVIREAGADARSRLFDSTFRSRLGPADKGRAAGVAGEGRLGGELRGPQGGEPGTGARSLSPAEVVGVGKASLLTPEALDAGYVYKAVREEALEAIRTRGLEAAEAPGLAWADGSRGRRNYFDFTPSSEGAILRVSRDKAGRLRRDAILGDEYVNRRVPNGDVEILGADGAWYPLRDFFEKPLGDPASAGLPPAPAVEAAAPGRLSQPYRDQWKLAGADDETVEIVSALIEARAKSLGIHPDELHANVRVVGAGVDVPADASTQLAQYRDRVARTTTREQLEAYMNEAPPPELVSAGLGDAAPVEWVALKNGQDLAIPGGLEGTFSLWDAWRLKSQMVNPNLLPDNVLGPLYEKLFRSQGRPLNNPVDTFNRLSFAMVSGQTPLLANEKAMAALRVSSVEDIARIANTPTAELSKLMKDIGTPVYPAQLETLRRNAARFVENPEWFQLRAGEDLVAYSERVMSVMDGSGMKVGNFSTMLGDPLNFDRGTIDARMVERIHRDGLVSPEIAKRHTDKGGGGIAPAARLLAPTHPDVPAHLKDLPWRRKDGKVLVYGNDYKAYSEAMVRLLQQDHPGVNFKSGGGQWMMWDLERGILEPHTTIWPGSERLPHLAAAEIRARGDVARQAGYFGRINTRGAESKVYGHNPYTGRPYSPRDAIFWQRGARGEATLPRGVEMMSVDDLERMVWENREFYPKAGPGATDLGELTTAIGREGFDPRRPISLSYDPVHHTAYIADGNTRLAAAKRLGMKEVPVTVDVFPVSKRRAKSAQLEGEPVLLSKGDRVAPSTVGLRTVKATEPPINPAEPWYRGEHVPEQVGPYGPDYRDAATMQMQGGDVIKGWTLRRETETIIGLTKHSDFSTSVHELYHGILEPSLLIDDIAILNKHNMLGEYGARAFERYLREGVAPTPELAGVFAKAKAFMLDIYRRLRGSPIARDFHPEVRSVFDRMLMEGMPDDVTAALRSQQDAGFLAGRVAEDTTLLARLREIVGKDGDILPGMEDEAQRINLAIEMGRSGRQAGIQGEIKFLAQRDAAVVEELAMPVPKYHGSLADRPDDFKRAMAAFEARLREEYPTYTLKAPPKVAVVLEKGSGTIVGQALKERTWLANALFDRGPLSRFTRYTDWLAEPVRNTDLGRAARQAIMEKLIPYGAKPEEVNRWLSTLEKEAAKHRFGPQDVRVFGGGTSLFRNTINDAAAGNLSIGVGAIFSEKVVAAVGRDNFVRLLDQASNRFIRMTDERIGAGTAGQLERALNTFYKGFQKTAAGDATRLVNKTFYHVFRFTLDARWHAMNLLEADILGGLRYGMSATRFRGANKAPASAPAVMHEFGKMPNKKLMMEMDATRVLDTTGWMNNRHLAGYISRAFDVERPESVLKVLREMPQNDPILASLQRKFGTAEDDIVKGIDDLLYAFDRGDGKAYITSEAAKILGDQITEPGMAALLTKVYERNQQVYEDITRVFRGNANRTNIERLMNSYWLYWPLSYQIKATRWLYGVMTHKIGGKTTNLGGAALYAHMAEQHNKLLVQSDDYRAMFEENQSLWLAAQMMFPITPGDIGVSLSRPLRYAGGALGLFGEYKNAQDPVTAMVAITGLGPIYSSQLLERIQQESDPWGSVTRNLFPSEEEEEEETIWSP